MNYTVIYIESHIMCILFLGTLFALRLKHWRPRYLNSMSAIYLITMLSSLLDIFWILLDGVARLRWLYHAVNIVYLSGFEFSAYFCLVECAKYLPFRLWRNRWQKLLYMLPAIIISLLIALSCFTGWIYGIDAQGMYYRGRAYFIQPMGYIYTLVSSGCALKACAQVKYTSEKKKLLSLAMFPLPPLLLGGLQIIAPPGSLPAIQFSITIALLIEFIVFLEGSITQDSLTGLSNRYALDRALNSKMNSRRSRSDGLFILMGDLDKFKSINDTYGHMEGDRALKMAADTLKSIFHDSTAVLARLGGDEFAIILEAQSPKDVQSIIDQINGALDRASANEPFHLAMSLGMAKYIGQPTATAFLKDADHALYLSKRKRAVQ